MRSPKDLLPPALRDAVRRHPAWRRYVSRREAETLAFSAKRLDICAAQMAHLLHASGHPGLQGRECLEIGSGRVLGYAVVCHLLGAKRVIATDLAPLAVPSALRTALHASTAYVVRDVLSPFEEHARIRQRLDRLLAVRDWSFGALRDVGIDYRAPLDLTAGPLGLEVDFAYSFSVLEHVPVRDVPAVLRHVARALRAGGAMAHAIHLEDHRDTARDPFAFLGADAWSEAEESERGNRLRRSRWQALFSDLDALDTRFVYEWSRPDAPLPPRIAGAVAYRDEPDLRVSHLGAYSVRRPVRAAG
jgi:SAM-dependent methyltransferase